MADTIVPWDLIGGNPYQQKLNTRRMCSSHGGAGAYGSVVINQIPSCSTGCWQPGDPNVFWSLVLLASNYLTPDAYASGKWKWTCILCNRFTDWMIRIFAWNITNTGPR